MKKFAKVAAVALSSAALVSAFAVAGCGQQHQESQLQIYAANSLSSAMDEAQAAYTASHDWITFADSQYLSSGNIVKELEGGAYSDVFFSASEAKMDDAESQGLIVTDTRKDVFDNDLVVIAQADSGITINSLDDIISGGYTLSVGDDTVPAGNYAAQSLYTIGAYTDASGKGGEYVGVSPVPATKVGDVATNVASGQVQLGIVFLSDSYRYADQGIEVVYTIPADAHKPITYPAAVCTSSTNQEEAAAFIDWCLNDAEAEAIWQKWGISLAK